MRDFFTRHPDATWPVQRRLHVYALANEALRAHVARYQDVLDDLAARNGLGLQPPDAVHFTVQALRPSAGELGQQQLDRLTVRLRAALAAVEPFTLRVGPPQASAHAVELWVCPDTDEQWRGLVEATRGAIEDVLGADALPDLDGAAVPHTSLGYGTGDGDSGTLASALKQHRAGLVEVPVREAHLLAVTQHPTEGRYSWDAPLATLPLGRQEQPCA